AWLLLGLLPALLRAPCSGEGRPKAPPCRQSPARVSCRGAGLREIPEELGRGVARLELSNNSIRSLPESRAPWTAQLEHLDLRSNRLEAVSEAALARLPRLRSLLLGSNRLDRNYLANGRAFRQLRNIEVLDLSRNNLESHMAGWYVRNLSTLRRLDLSGNSMTGLPAGVFRSAPALRELDLSNNYIMRIAAGAFEALRELRALNLALNSLRCVSGFTLRGLRVLNLSRNALELFAAERGGERRYGLRVLDLSHNRLLLFPELPGARDLTHLNLSGNAIASLLPASRRPEFALPYGEAERFNNNNGSLGSAAHLSRVADLDLSNNRLHQLPFAFFHRLPSLRRLDVSRNCLQEVTKEPLAGDAEGGSSLGAPEPVLLSVRSLDLHSNSMRSLPRWFFDLLPRLESIDLGSNSLQPCESRETGKGEISGGASRAAAPGGTCTAFYNIPVLKHLSLHNNNIARLYPYAFNQTPLVSLDLSDNKDLFLPKEALQGLEFSLQNLSLRGNRMRDSRAELPCLRALKALDLSSNNLSLLPAGLSCSPLESLDIRRNSLASLGEPARWPRGLRLVAVAGNPLGCCALDALDA
ncbi:LRC32 protein, partial [Crypturellus soui]|nr:LRC32 protein [Crypturellus soui]